MDGLDLGRVTTHWCNKCNQWETYLFDGHLIKVDGVLIELKGVPLLRCQKCERYDLPERTKRMVAHFAHEARSNSHSRVRLTPKSKRRFKLCKVELVYSPEDYYIPGLEHPQENGFLIPVFFKLSVLNKYTQYPAYRLELVSDTYGFISKSNQISIPFGINPSGKVIMWLGDIDRLPKAEQHYLRSENIKSDHNVRSEFYEAQIECRVTEPSLEGRLIKARSELNTQCRRKFGTDLYQLQGEISNVIENLRRPIFWQEKHVGPTVESFNRILTESLDVQFLKRQVKPVATAKDLEGTKSLKLVELWLKRVLGCSDASTLMSPFFVLYDFRILACHLVADGKRKSTLVAINLRLGLRRNNAKFDRIYNGLLPKLTTALVQLRALVDSYRVRS